MGPLLIIVRHGPAEDTSVSGADRDRELTSDGRRIVQKLGERLRQHLDDRLESSLTLVSSPYARARQTAELLAHGLSGEPGIVSLHDELGLAFAQANGLEAAEQLLRHRDSALIAVSHQPLVEHLLSRFLPDGTTCALLDLGFRTAVAACVLDGNVTVIDPRR